MFGCIYKIANARHDSRFVARASACEAGCCRRLRFVISGWMEEKFKGAGKMPALRTGSYAPTNRRGLPRFCFSHRSNQAQCRARPPDQVAPRLLPRNAGILPALLTWTSVRVALASHRPFVPQDKLKPVLLSVFAEDARLLGQLRVATVPPGFCGWRSGRGR